jgi:hypothetical protein
VDEFSWARTNTALASKTAGYHWYGGGQVQAVVQVADEAVMTLVMTHEVAEALVNPRLDRFITHGQSRRMLEIADMTEDGFLLTDAHVSNFALPSYFQSHGAFPYDYMGVLALPFENFQALSGATKKQVGVRSPSFETG